VFRFISLCPEMCAGPLDRTRPAWGAGSRRPPGRSSPFRSLYGHRELADFFLYSLQNSLSTEARSRLGPARDLARFAGRKGIGSTCV